MAAVIKIDVQIGASGGGAKQVIGDLSELDGAARKASGGFSFMGQAAATALGGVVASAATAAAGAVAGFVGGSISAAGDFEGAVNNLAAVSGTALADAGFNFDDVSAKALQLGQDTRYSASESIAAMTELVKGGVPVAEVMNEATDATLNLAAAAGVDLTNAAEIVAKQFGVWSDTGVDATQVSNLLTQAANASTVGVEDLALGLANAGGTAKTAGLSYQELVESMALIAPNFSSASDAGTSFKTFLSRLIPTTNPAKAAMRDLGLYTAETGSAFYDTSGQFIGMKAAAELLQNATANLSEEERLLAFNTIFGSDAIRAAAAIAESGAEGFDDIGEAMRKAGTAAEVAAIQNQGWNFVMDSLKGSIETLQITIGTVLLPVLTPLVEKLGQGVGVLSNLVGALSGSRRAFDELPAPIQGVLAPLLGMSGALSSMSEAVRNSATPMLTWKGIFDALPTPLQDVVRLLDGIGRIVQAQVLPALTTFVGTVGAPLQGVLAPLLPMLADLLNRFANIAQFIANANIPLGLIFSLLMGGNPIIAAAIAIFQNWDAILALAQEHLGGVSGALQPLLAWLGENWPQVVGAAGGILAAVLVPALATAAGAFAGVLVAIAPIAGAFMLAAAIGAALAGAWSSNFMNIQGVTASALAAVQSVIMSVLSVVQEFWANNGAEIMAFTQTTWATIQQIVGTIAAIVAEIVTRVFSGIAQFINQHGDEIQAVMEFAWQGIQNITDLTLGIIQGIVNTVLGVIRGDWEAAGQGIQQIVTTLKDFVTAEFNRLLGMVQSLGPGFISAAKEIGSAIIDGIVNGISDGVGAIIDAAKDAAQSALDAAKGALGISSPSRVFAQQVGLPSAQGIAMGLGAGIPVVAAAGATAAGAALAGGRSVVSNATRNVTYNATFNGVGSSGVSDAIARSLAGV